MVAFLGVEDVFLCVFLFVCLFVLYASVTEHGNCFKNSLLKSDFFSTFIVNESSIGLLVFIAMWLPGGMNSVVFVKQNMLK